MAVVVSIARGHDASYPFKTIGAADGPVITGERGAGYYLSAVEKGGEPAGTWVGNGAADLGFRDGDVVRREDFEPLYGQFLDPRDPSGQTYLGSPPRVNAELAAIYQAKLAAHPGATADERMRLLAEARAEYEGPVGVQYFDTTFSVDKTISLAHASALASAVEARQAGDLRQAAEWEARAAGIWAEIEKSVRLYVRHMQGEAAYVRTGHHGRRIDGVETGRFEDAREIPVAIFPQHTSRNGDPQLHVHVLWLNKVQTVRDGRWRAIDSRGLYREKGAGSALAAFALETGLTRRFGFEWAYRPASKGRVIAGFPEKAIAQFSSRRAQITKATLALAEAYEKERGHAPDQRALASMRQFANARTRRAKEPGALDFAAAAARLGADLARRGTRDAARPRANHLARGTRRSARQERARRTRGTRADGRAARVTRGTHARARTRGHGRGTRAGAGVTRRVDPRGPGALHRPAPARPRDRPGPGARLAAPRTTHRPGARRAGRGGGVPPGRPRMAARPRQPAPRERGEHLPGARRRAVRHPRAAVHGGAAARRRASRRRAASCARAGRARCSAQTSRNWTAQLHADAPAPDGVTQGGLRLDQATAAFLALTSPRRAELIVGPAGTGKTYTAVRIAEAWRAAGMGQVYGIATTSAGRNVLLEAGIPVAENTAQFLGHLPGQRRGPRRHQPRPGRAGHPGRGQHHLDARPGRDHPARRPVRRQAGHHRGPRPARRRAVRGRHGDAGPQARPRPAHRGRPVPQRLGRHRVAGHPRRGRRPRSVTTTRTAGCTAAATRRWPSRPPAPTWPSTWPGPT